MALRVAVAAAWFAAACSPYGGGTFVCTSSDQCGIGGVCEPDGYCAFASGSCMSGYKYGELSGPVANQCVGATGGPDGGTPDGSRADAPLDGPLSFCYGTGLVTACFASQPTGALELPATIDTGTYACADVIGHPPWCVIAADTISASGTVQVTGAMPLVLVAVSTISVTGTLDVASHRGGPEGAGADATTCNAGTAPSGGKDGGAGGSFGGAGGDGAGGAGKGIAGGVLTTPGFQGGCPGQDGGGGGSGGAKGHGGGAVYLIANTSISITGTIDASGAGANGARGNGAGGGGGGSGGMIGLDSPAVTAGAVFANGGGGGEGGTAIGTPGGNGEDPMMPLVAARGGSASMTGGDGGDGAAGQTETGSSGSGGNSGGGNGGGGGGAGIIMLDRATAISGGQISPAPR